jgi:beta-glucosidase
MTLLFCLLLAIGVHANAAAPETNPAAIPVRAGGGDDSQAERNTWTFGANGEVHVSGGEAGDGIDGKYAQDGGKIFLSIGDDRFIAHYDGKSMTFGTGDRSNPKNDIPSLEGRTLETSNWESHDWWSPRHEAILKRISKGNVDLIFVGDSITHHWTEGAFLESRGGNVWDDYYGHRNAVNMGFAGDDTCNVLWRVQNGEIDGIAPKLAVLMIGTNNTGDNQTPEQIGGGIIAIVNTIREKLPQTNVLLLGVFPRGKNPSPLRDMITEINEYASKVADGTMIHYLDIGAKFLNPDGTISPDIMPDYTHPSEKAYRIWAEAIEPKVRELMDE